MSELIGKTSENEYRGESLRIFNGTYREGRVEIPVELAIHPNQSRRIIINVPGYNGVIDGFAEKYKILAHHIQSQNLAAVVRTGNILGNGRPADINLNAALFYTERHIWEICGEEKAEILLMGFSAGASAIAARANEHPLVKKIILFAPSENMPFSALSRGMRKFGGEVYIIVGEEDDVVGLSAGPMFYDFAKNAQKRELFLIPDCNHQFSGEKNGRIISQAPFYAFASKDSKPKFPDPEGGIKLYD